MFKIGGVFILGFFFGGGGDFCFLVWVRARSLGFRFLEASWFPWLLGFSVSGLLGPFSGLLGLSTSCNLVAWSIIIAFCSCMASWFPWLLGFSVSGLLGHLTSCSFLVLYGLLASWFPWLFGLSACWPLDFL